MTRTMYDSVTVADIPATAVLAAAYVDGHYANVDAVKKQCPKARVVRITVTGNTLGANVIDCETGDATPAQAAAWAKRMIASKAHPTIYCNASTWPAVKVEVGKQGIARQVSYWIAQYDNKAVIPAGAVAKQYKSTTKPNLDTSVVADYWPGVDPAPKPAPKVPAKVPPRVAPKPAAAPAKPVVVPSPVPHLTADQWVRLQRTTWWRLILRWLRIK